MNQPLPYVICPAASGHQVHFFGFHHVSFTCVYDQKISVNPLILGSTKPPCLSHFADCCIFEAMEGLHLQ